MLRFYALLDNLLMAAISRFATPMCSGEVL